MDVVDALFVLQCGVNIPNTFCPGVVIGAAAPDADPATMSLLALAQEMAESELAGSTDEVSSADAGLALYRERLAAIELDENATAQAAQVDAQPAAEAANITKYYHPSTPPRTCFGGMRIAMHKRGDLYYLHGDHTSTPLSTGLGSTIAETNTSGQRTMWREYTPFWKNYRATK